MTHPNFFILGSAKSGTTTLYHFLKQHPDIYLTDEKEPNFYNKGFRIIKSEADYRSLYSQVTTELIIGEASHAYLTDFSCAETLQKNCPDAKFMVILRNPAERAYSLYKHMLRHGYETINSFELALEQEEYRLNSNEFISSCDENINNFAYFKSGLYGQQIEHYFKYFKKEQFHFLTLKDLAEKPQETLNKALDFLNLQANNEQKLTTQNDSKKTPISPGLRKWMRTTFKSSSHSIIVRLVNRVNSKNSSKLDSTTYQELMSKYQEDLKKVEYLTGLRLM